MIALLVTQEFSFLSRRREASGAGMPSGERPLVWNDTDSFIEPKVQALMQDFAARERVFAAMKNVRESLRGHGRS